MKRRGCSSSTTSAAIEDLKKFMDDQLELFKFETEEMLEQMIKQVKELAAEDSAKKRIKKAARMPKTAGQAQNERSTQSGPQHETDSSSRNCIMPVNDVRAGSAIVVVDNDLEAERQENGSICSKNEGENEKEMEDAGIEDLSSVKGRRMSRRTIKEPAWMKDFMTV
ncbi:hypothetical protein ACET3Z_006785 [Daucus carota]|uniref:Uncharacterized protein n=2 Tax=Daucus carota subsp. sativus TaxID=79200 RepID=A0A166E017_DAUCS